MDTIIKADGYMEYKEYLGSVEYSIEDEVLYGVLVGIKDKIIYEGESIPQLKKMFEEAVDDYLLSCKEHGITPQKPCKGQFNVRISPALHQQAVIQASKKHISLNKLVEKAIESYVQ